MLWLPPAETLPVWASLDIRLNATLSSLSGYMIFSQTLLLINLSGASKGTFQYQPAKSAKPPFSLDLRVDFVTLLHLNFA
jgi:hypothetical protein